MNIVNGNPNIYFVHEVLDDDNNISIELYPVIAFELDNDYKHKIIALNLGKVEGTLFDCNLKCFISSNGIRKPPREYIKDYQEDGLIIYISKESQDLIDLSPKDESPMEVTIVDESGYNITSSLGVSVYGSVSIDE